MISSNNLINDKPFRKLALLTVLIIYLLILVGGIVRSTGSGMGCPDWPKCFGQWIPPTDVSQLPPHYKELYSQNGHGSTVFNVTKTWTEYLNRLLGVFTGFFIFLTLVASFRYLKRDRAIPLLSFLAFVLVGVQGWLGSVVVKTSLTPWIVTLHMLLAIVIVGVLIYVVARTYAVVIPPVRLTDKARLNLFLISSTVLLLVQILFGTQVRENVDYVASTLGDSLRDRWIGALDTEFYVHRSFSLVVLASQILWLALLRKQANRTVIYTLALRVVGLVVLNIAFGAAMAYFAIPAFLQPVHLTVAVVSLGIQFLILLLLNKEKLFEKDLKVATSVQV